MSFDGWGDGIPLEPGTVLNTAVSDVAQSSPILGYILRVALASGEGYPSNQDPFTAGSWSGDPFTGSWDPFIESQSGGLVLDLTGLPPIESFTTYDIQDPFSLSAPEDASQNKLASNGIIVVPGGPLQQLNTLTPQMVDGQVKFVPTYGPYVAPLSSAQDFSYSLPVSDEHASNLAQSLTGPPVSQPSPATGQPTPQGALSTVIPATSDYNPAAERGDAPQVYVPPSPPPIENWPTTGLSAPPSTSSPPTLAPPSNAVAPSLPDSPQTTEAPRDFWSTWIGDATQVEPAWRASWAPDRRMFQPITHYDMGNRPINYLLNKVVFPWQNLLGSIENFAMTPLLGLSDLFEDAKNNPDFGGDVQNVSDHIPLQGAMGLTMEIEPALDWMFTNVTTGPNSPFWWFMGAGGVGGGGSLGPLQSTAIGAELGPLSEEAEVAIPPAAERAATLFQDTVNRAQSLLRANPDLVMELGGSSRGAPISPNQLGAAIRQYSEGEPGFARALAGNAMEAAVNAFIEDLPPGEGSFLQVSGPSRIDFIGTGAFQGYTFELTTEAGVAEHAVRTYMQEPGAMIFTYPSIIE